MALNGVALVLTSCMPRQMKPMNSTPHNVVIHNVRSRISRNLDGFHCAALKGGFTRGDADCCLLASGANCDALDEGLLGCDDEGIAVGVELRWVIQGIDGIGVAPLRPKHDPRITTTSTTSARSRNRSLTPNFDIFINQYIFSVAAAQHLNTTVGLGKGDGVGQGCEVALLVESRYIVDGYGLVGAPAGGAHATDNLIAIRSTTSRRPFATSSSNSTGHVCGALKEGFYFIL